MQRFVSDHKGLCHGDLTKLLDQSLTYVKVIHVDYK